ncbi:MAG: 30S ribosomal protein S18 [bacterium]|nr:30S ribosomal protein S18 [bacterium]
MTSTNTPAESGDSSSSSTSSTPAPRPTGSGPRRSKFGRFGQKRREVEPEEPLDYKNVAYLSKFVSPNGRILSRKRSGFSGQNQRKLANAIKNARLVGLMPFIGRV